MKRNTIIVGTLTLISLLLGFGRESYIAYLFGATDATDAYYVAMIVPDLVAGWIGYTVTNALIPVLRKEWDRSLRSGEQLITTAFLYVGAASLALAAGVYVMVHQVVGLLAPNFSAMQHETGDDLLRIMAIAILFSALSGLFSGINNTFEQFVYSSLVGIMYNAFFFLTLLVLYRWLGIQALAYGLLAGVVGRCLVQMVPLLRSRKLKLELQLWHPSMKIVVKAMVPIFLSQALTQINQIVDRILASGLPAGQISNLNYASKLGQLPTGLIGGTIATTMYIRFVRSHNEGNLGEMGRLYRKGVSWIIFAGLLVSSGLIFYGDSLVAVFYYHGKFTLGDLHVTASLLQIYGGFSFFYMMLPITVQFFFSFHGGQKIILASVGAVIANLVCGYALVQSYGVKGLVVANGLSVAANVLILYTLAMRKLQAGVLRHSLQVLQAVAPGGAVLLAALIGYALVVPSSVEASKLLLMARGGGALLVTGVLVLLVAKAIFRHNDILSTLLKMVEQAVKRLIPRKKVQM
ncbi:virulence factor MVIN family protein [Paenibacillus curdlanolyticus YK9]|uniref:Virulence factor MVIN family protein n=1 Tax=Paenibacillus curdlanolyticus YK9 TaxID=717606 RepID=E0IER4_9BACL|nr:lipid II flippase MurJ [Paenibacillus curdlanolyticus]EFM09152.1 virulence factor MVIN family protein [Paenibacillus curdlanolyticus YK9]